VNGILTGALNLSEMVIFWIALGAMIAALSAAYLPAHWFDKYMGPDISGLGVTLLVATVLEVCSEGMAPVGYEIYRQTGAFGNVFVFLMAGVITDYTEIGLIWKNIGHKTALLLPIITVPQVLVLGYIANQLF